MTYISGSTEQLLILLEQTFAAGFSAGFSSPTSYEEDWEEYKKEQLSEYEPYTL